MTTKIVKILTEILEGINRKIPLDELNIELVKNKEFDQRILSVAFSLLYDHVLPASRKSVNSRKSLPASRIFGQFEIDALGIDNYSYLLHLFNIGMLDERALESIIEQVSIYPEGEITRDDIDWIILFSLVDMQSEILPGSRVLLYSSDVIN